MKLSLNLSIVHQNHNHPISNIIMENVDLTIDEIIEQFSIVISKELIEILEIANNFNQDIRILLPLLTIRSSNNPIVQLATTIFLTAYSLELKHIILVLECNGSIKTLDTNKPTRYS